MKKSVYRFVALVSGVLFGSGMAISGMIDPEKVTGFLDIAGYWDPSLAFVMGGALMVFMPSYLLLIKPRKQSVSGKAYSLPTNKKIDQPLIMGAVMFGLGWGIAGICPGPAVASLAMGNLGIVIFFVSMVVGSLVANIVTSNRKSNSACPVEVN